MLSLTLMHLYFVCFQEAKSSCAGQWYLPAGRMEPGEDVTEAAKREVLEETGMDFEPTTLLAVESAGKQRLLLSMHARLGGNCSCL